ncbi:MULTISPECIES: hypothetical protein [Amycolatopsis]|uniref:Uncharacterized protein n=1 Tax=Amycolatopsis echigonensis TaxID=2576905 RepID=A0A2N3WNL0_9PSEU|nr:MULTISPECIES: hypothetical protein [Amycolatopsis]PKV95458.1 hypothetical protein ATK30_6379 [Amycolatopsis niigatensis]
MGIKRIVALSTTAGAVGFAGIFGTAGLASTAEQGPTSYAYLAGLDGLVAVHLHAPVGSAASPVAPATDSDATASESEVLGASEFKLGLADGSLEKLKATTTADPAAGRSAAQISGAGVKVTLKLTLRQVVNLVDAHVVNSDFPKLMDRLDVISDLPVVTATLYVTGLNESCQAGPAGATAGGSLAEGRFEADLPFGAKIDQSVDVKRFEGSGYDFGRGLTLSTKVVQKLPDGGVSFDAVSVGTGDQKVNLGHVECHPGAAEANAG